jgi:hypothetical protein
LLADIAYGYDVVPIVHRRGHEIRPIPADDVRLEASDRIVMIATMDGLRHIETTQRIPPNWLLSIDNSPSLEASFEAANVIARISGAIFESPGKPWRGYQPDWRSRYTGTKG